MRKKNTETIGEAIRQIFAENPFLRQKIGESRVLNAWKTVMGDTIGSYTRQLYFKQGTLFVHLSSAPLRHQLVMNRQAVMQRLNAEAGMQVIQDIVFR